MATEARHLLLLLSWMSPAFPTGSFAYSHGLEWVISDGLIRKADDLRSWIGDLLARGSGWNDAVLFSNCWKEDPGILNELALALAVSKERHLETTQLGRAFNNAARVFLPAEGNIGNEDIAYPVAAGLACRRMEIEKKEALLAYLQGYVAALTSVAVRLVPLGQTQGLEVIRDLMPAVTHTAECAMTATLDDLGSAAIMSDIAAMKHETMETRIFRT
jgi:urease accessory protein